MTAITPPSRPATLIAPADGLLRLSLRADAVVTGANGLAYLALSGLLDDLLGLDRGAALAIGVFLTGYALGVAATGAPRRISPVAAGTVVVGNAAWALLSVVAVVTGVLSLTAPGAVWAVLQALVVGGFAAAQYRGLRRAR